MPRFGLIGGTYQAISANWDAEEALNIACEILDAANAKTKMGMFRTPGRQKFASMAIETSLPGLFPINGRLFGASANFYEVLAGGQTIQYGSLNGQPQTPTMIISNQTQLLILSNGSLFVFTLATNAFVAVNMAQFNGPVSQIVFSDGYGIATILNSNTFQQSNLEDFTTWQGLNIATISYFPDNITSIGVAQRQPVIYSGKKSIIYQNTGAGFPVFQPIPNTFIENGAGATYATTLLDNTLFWLDQDERGAFIARRLNGTVGERVSTHATELAWQNYTKTSDAVGYSYQENGHLFWMIYFPTANISWGYDVSTQLWHKRGRWNPNLGTYEAEHAMCHAYAFGKHLVGDWATGTVYWQSMMFNTDNGNAIRWLRRSPSISKENTWIYYQELRVDVETGQVPTAADVTAWTSVYGSAPLLDGNGIARDPQINLRWSNNNGLTWSNEYVLDARAVGKYGKIVRKKKLGRGRNRLWELSGTDPVPWFLADAYVYADAAQSTERIADQMRKVS